MSLFQCEKCGCLENTALSNYAWLKFCEKKPAVCSACDEEINEWHGEFERIYLPMGKFHTNGVGNLEHTETGSTDVKAFQIDAPVDKEE